MRILQTETSLINAKLQSCKADQTAVCCGEGGRGYYSQRERERDAIVAFAVNSESKKASARSALVRVLVRIRLSVCPCVCWWVCPFAHTPRSLPVLVQQVAAQSCDARTTDEPTDQMAQTDVISNSNQCCLPKYLPVWGSCVWRRSSQQRLLI